MKLRTKEIIKGKNFLSLSGNMVGALIGFLSFIVLTRSIDKTSLGMWLIFMAGGSFAEMLRYGPLKTAVIRKLSGANSRERMKVLGSNYFLSIVISVGTSLLLWAILLLFYNGIKNSAFYLFFLYYPFLSIINVPYNNAQIVFNADQKFGSLLRYRTVFLGMFLAFLLVNFLYFRMSVASIVIAYLIINMIISLVCIINKTDGLTFFRKYDRSTIAGILSYGKYTTGTLIGSNLLKSSDGFMIGLSPVLGAQGIALYGIPLKLTEIIEIPLRSFAATALPQMSKANLERRNEDVKQLFYKYSGLISLLYLFMMTISFVFAETLVVLLGGQEYIQATPIFRIFCIYGLILPLDRFSGIALDSLNRPKFNFIKVILMVLTNIAGNFAAIFYFESLEIVAFTTILMTVFGSIYGYLILNRHFNIRFVNIFSQAYLQLKNYFKRPQEQIKTYPLTK